MTKIAFSIDIDSDEELIALQGALRRTHEASQGLEQAAIGKALTACQNAIQVRSAQAVVANAHEKWGDTRSELSIGALSLVRRLKKGMTKQGVAAVAALHQITESQAKSTLVFIDDSDFRVEGYLRRPGFWRSAVEASEQRQQALVESIKASTAALKVSSEPYPVPSDPLVAKAVVEAWGKAVAMLADLGTQSEDLNAGSLYEAALYATYARAFATDDIKTVATLYRQAKRDQDSLLRTFTDSMAAAANQFTEREGLVWQADQVARQRPPGPR